MAGFCPFFSTPCPESNSGPEGCAIWTDFGCCIIDKPGIPAIYTDGEADPVDVFILGIYSGNAKIDRDILIVFAYKDGGTIDKSNVLSDFAVYVLG